MKTILTFISTFIFFGTFAQQDPATTLFWNSFSLRNPAATGLFNKHFAALNGRLQWDEVDGAPRTASAIYDLKWDQIHGGIGINYEIDKIGFNTQHLLNLNYGYHFSLSETKKLSLGTSIHFLQFAMNPVWYPPQTYNDNSLPPAFRANSVDMNLGAMYKSDKLLLGLSVNHILASRVLFSNSSVYQLARHYYANCSYRFDLSENFQLVPSILLQSDIVKASGNFNLRAIYKKQYWIGTSYRTSDCISFMGGVDLKQKYRICYAYDFTIGKLSSVSQGSHEVGIALMID